MFEPAASVPLGLPSVMSSGDIRSSEMDWLRTREPPCWADGESEDCLDREGPCPTPGSEEIGPCQRPLEALSRTQAFK